MVRQKNRYLLCQFLYPSPASSRKAVEGALLPDLISFHQPTTDTLTASVLTRSIRADVASLFGDYGAGVIAASLSIKYLSPATSTFIVRVARAHYRLVWAALSFMTQVPADGTPCVVRVVRVSGTIRKAEEEAIRRARQLVLRAKKGEDGLTEDSAVEHSLAGFEEVEQEEDLGEVVDMSDIDDDEDNSEDDNNNDDDDDDENSGADEDQDDQSNMS